MSLTKPKPEPKTEKSYEARTWHFDPQTKQIAQLEGKEYALIPASPQDIQKVIGFYAHHPVPGYGVSQVEVIYNPGFNRSFELHLRKLQQRENNPAFVPQWSSMTNTHLRQTTYDLFIEYTQPYVDSDYPAVKLLPTWHGTKPQVLDSLFSAGYANLATTDAGYFGKGYYSAYEAEYSYRVYSKGALILNWVASFSPLPVIDGDMGKLEGKGNYGNYDAHFVPVAPLNPTNPDETIYFPCKENQPHQYTEMVVFDSAALLPRYLVALQPEGLGLRSPVMPVVTPPQKTLEKKDTITPSQHPVLPSTVVKPPVTHPGESVYFEGLLAYHHAQYKKAHTRFMLAALKEYPPAYMKLGNFYQKGGYIGPKNTVVSEKWYDKVRMKIDWFKAQAQTGQADAQYNLGWCYNFGVGVDKDATQAMHYYRLAAEQGHAIAQNMLGYCYEIGQDFTRAARYYRLAAEQNYVKAQNNLGLCYYHGRGVDKDFKQALQYYHLAAQQGYAEAQTTLGICYHKGEGGLVKDFFQSERYFRLAAEQGHANGQEWLGVCYHYGQGVRDYAPAAAYYYRLAIEQSSDHAQTNLNRLFETSPNLRHNSYYPPNLLLYFTPSISPGKELEQWMQNQNQLVAACLNGNIALIKQLELQGASLLCTNEEGLYPLVAAVYGCRLEMVKYVELQLKDEAGKQWTAVDPNKALENLNRWTPTELSKDAPYGELGNWYVKYNGANWCAFYDSECLKRDKMFQNWGGWNGVYKKLIWSSEEDLWGENGNRAIWHQEKGERKRGDGARWNIRVPGLLLSPDTDIHDNVVKIICEQMNELKNFVETKSSLNKGVK